MRIKSVLLALCVTATMLTIDANGAEQFKKRSSVKVGVSAAKIKAIAAELDRLIERNLASARLKPNAMTDDATFIRRAYLNIVGRIPTAKEVSMFLGSKSLTKRQDLIDRLLDSPGYTSSMFNWWSDILRVRSKLSNNIIGQPYIHFIKRSIADNKPYDQFVSEMLTSIGPNHVANNGATGYYSRDRGMPEDNMSNTVRVFLGTRLECAQCHDHPFDKWTQKEYFEMVAFTGGINYRNDALKNSSDGDRLKKMGAHYESKYNKLGRKSFYKTIQMTNYGIGGTGTGLTRLPHDYQYDDAKPSQIVKARSMFGPNAKVEAKIPVEKKKPRTTKKGKKPGLKAPQVESRKAYAAWLTSPKNPRFAKVIANRLWKQAMGMALIEPVDDITDQTKPSNPALMARLSRLMVELKFDMKQFQRVLYNTKTFQRHATQKDHFAGTKYYFQGPLLRRMSGEQIWDSMLTMVEANVDSTIREPGTAAKRVYKQYEDLVHISKKEADDKVGLWVLRYSDRDKYQKLTRERREAEKKKERSESLAAYKKLSPKAKVALRDYGKARKAADQDKMADLLVQMREMKVPARMYEGKGKAYGRNTMARASELPQPARPGHFLQRFGQSDREQIQANHTDPAVPQVLSLVNGFVETQILTNPKSTLMRTMAKVATSEQKIETAYLSVLARHPSRDEMAIWKADVAADGEQVYKDLIWTLANTHEFMFIR